MRRVLIASALLGLLGSQTALAQGAGVWPACRIKVICAGVQPGAGRMVDCLREHKDQLSEACYAALGHQMINRRPHAAGAMKAAPAAPAANAGAAPAAPAANAGAPPAADGDGDIDAAPPVDDPTPQ